MAKYIKKEVVDLNKKGTTRAYYRMKTWGQMDCDEFIKRCHKSVSVFPTSAIRGVLITVTEQLAYELGRGYSVKIDGLGTFTAKLGVKKDKELDGFEEGTVKRNASSIEVTGVSLRIDKELVKAIRRDCQLERGGVERLHISKLTLEERIAKARDYLERHQVMRVAQYAALTGLSHSTASRELLRLAADPATGITCRVVRSSKIYLLRSE